MIRTEPAFKVRPDVIPEESNSAVPAKIRAHHQDRSAVVYVRQASTQQVLEHRESTALQYNLRRKAIEWGWLSERVLVIDEDQGHSSTQLSTAKRFRSSSLIRNAYLLQAGGRISKIKVNIKGKVLLFEPHHGLNTIRFLNLITAPQAPSPDP